ncbi:MAG: hypothetical protein P8L49_05265 [Opitutaceae bacterium]|nr:hypothetical protein [Opitutaceae bacterium]
MSERLVYLILGSKGAGQDDVVSDLVDFGVADDLKPQVFVSEDDVSAWGVEPTIHHKQVGLNRYSWQGFEAGLAFEPTGDVVFVVADGLADPADFVEAFFFWFQESGYEIGRVITVADCDRISADKRLLPWYDCCIHFSDIVLLSNRQTVSNKWIEEFKNRYAKEYYPCHFELVKKGRLANPSFTLEPQSRRISKLFDEVDVSGGNGVDALAYLDDDVEIGGVEEEEPEEDDEEEFEGGDPSKDPFLARVAKARRDRPLPDVSKLLG